VVADQIKRRQVIGLCIRTNAFKAARETCVLHVTCEITEDPNLFTRIDRAIVHGGESTSQAQ
jgi:hypothetical protein